MRLRAYSAAFKVGVSWRYNPATTGRSGAVRAQAPHPGGHQRASLGRARAGADLPDRDGGRRLLAEGLRRKLPRLELVWADEAYTGGFRDWAKEELGWRVEVPYYRDRQLWRYGLEEEPRGFRVMPRYWVVERTFAWLSKDYQRLPEMAVAMILWAMSRIILRRLAGGAR